MNENIKIIFNSVFAESENSNRSFFDYALPLIDRVKSDKATFIMKVDGQQGASTCIITKGDDLFIRYDSDSLEDAILSTLNKYFQN